MLKQRIIDHEISAKPTVDGAGVSLQRLLSYPQTKEFDPFLMLDYFSTTDTSPGPGFPWHPHRGIITITYMLEGAIEHEDSLGNKGLVFAGGVQWMKAASGIIHKEMPKPSEKGIAGLQFWLNLPANLKMSSPAYGELTKEEFPEVIVSDNGTVKVIAGSFHGNTGPLSFDVTEPEIFDIELQESISISIPTNLHKNYFLIPIWGEIFVNDKKLKVHEASHLSEGEEVTLCTRKLAGRVLLIGGNKLNEPIAWEGPIVMNTSKELQTAFDEYRNDTFIK